MTSPAFDVVVIGAGTNGLVAAARLARAGKRVLLLEREERAGGRGRLVEIAPGFRAAPLGLDPGWVPPRIASALELAGLEQRTIDAPLSVATGSGGFLSLPPDPARAAHAIGPHSKADAARWGSFTSLLHSLAGFLESLYRAPALDLDIASLADALPLAALGWRFRKLGRRDMIELLRTLPLSVWDLADDWFESSAVKAAIASGGIKDVRQGPRSGGTGFVLLHHMVGARPGALRGRTPWRSGPGAFAEAAQAAAVRAGVGLRFGAEVARLRVNDDAVTGVVLASGEEIDARAVLSTAGPVRTMLGWIDPVWLDPEYVRALLNVRHRGCTAFLAYALDGLPEARGLPPDALAGTVSFTSSVVALERAADAAKYGRVSEAPHVELTVPTLLWPELAPAGKHVAVARVQYAPYTLRDGAAWDGSRRDALAAMTLDAIETELPGFGARILHQRAFTPRDLEDEFGLHEGSPSQGELALDQILFMRPVPGWGRHTTPIAGLYLGGVGSHPGPGILGGAGWLAAASLLGGRIPG